LTWHTPLENIQNDFGSNKIEYFPTIFLLSHNESSALTRILKILTRDWQTRSKILFFRRFHFENFWRIISWNNSDQEDFSIHLCPILINFLISDNILSPRHSIDLSQAKYSIIFSVNNLLVHYNRNYSLFCFTYFERKDFIFFN
jgi:hypothetical protein